MEQDSLLLYNSIHDHETFTDKETINIVKQALGTIIIMTNYKTTNVYNEDVNQGNILHWILLSMDPYSARNFISALTFDKFPERKKRDATNQINKLYTKKNSLGLTPFDLLVHFQDVMNLFSNYISTVVFIREIIQKIGEINGIQNNLLQTITNLNPNTTAIEAANALYRYNPAYKKNFDDLVGLDDIYRSNVRRFRRLKTNLSQFGMHIPFQYPDTEMAKTISFIKNQIEQITPKEGTAEEIMVVANNINEATDFLMDTGSILFPNIEFTKPDWISVVNGTMQRTGTVSRISLMPPVSF